eukprot:scaffold1970_cov114-Isochrysis_galbana.AAC.3
MASDDSSSEEEEDEKRRRAELLSCVVTGDQVQKAEADRVEARQERQARQAAAAAGATTGADPSNTPVPTGFEKHATNRLHALLERTFEMALQPGVWSSRSIQRGIEVPVSELRLFAGRELVFRHVHPLATERVGAGSGGVGAADVCAAGDGLNDSAMACSERGPDGADTEKARRKAPKIAEGRAGWQEEGEKGQGGGERCPDGPDQEKARRKAERKAARKAERRAGRQAEREKGHGREDGGSAQKKAKRPTSPGN